MRIAFIGLGAMGQGIVQHVARAGHFVRAWNRTAARARALADRVAAAIDLKADRAAGELRVQQWSWIDGPREGDKARIEEGLGRFERFQFGD